MSQNMNKKKKYTMSQNEINLLDVESISEPKTSPKIEELRPSQAVEKDLAKASIQEISTQEKARNLLEAALFSTNMPVSFKKLKNIVLQLHPFKNKEIEEIIEDLRKEYSSPTKGIILDEREDGYILVTDGSLSEYLYLLHENKRGARLSHAGRETLAIIAYKQPVTRADVEAIRGVDSSGIMHTLHERELITSVGKLEAPGRPTLFGTTPLFLEYFGLKKLEDLPEFKKKLEKKEDKEKKESDLDQ